MSSSSSVLINALLSSGPDYDVLFDSLCWHRDQWPVRTHQIDALTAFIEGLHGPLLLLTDDESETTPVEEDTTPCSSSSSPPAGENTKNAHCRLTAAKRRLIISKIESVVWSQCIALLARISADDTASASRGGITTVQESTGAACRLLGACAPLCDASVPDRLWHCVLPALQPPKSDDEHDHHHSSEEEAALVRRIANVDVAVEVMAVLLPALTSSQDDKHERLAHAVLSSALSFVKRTPDTVAVSKVAVRILLTLLNCYGGGGGRGSKLGSALQFIVEDLCRWHASDCTDAVTERTLLCLTVLSDHLFLPTSQQAPSGHPDPRLSVQFWRMVQDGLTHTDNVSRKRSLYLLKRAVARSEEEEACHCPRSSSDQDEILFRWDPSRSKLLREFWEDYALVMETLEENQIHVIRPVLNRIDMLIQTTASDSEVSGCGLFHPSWLLCVYQRMFHSENKSLMKEGVWHLLDLQALQQPAFASAFSKFIVGPFMDVLSEGSLFHRAPGQSVGDCPELGVKLRAFMVTFFTSLPLEDRGPVLLQLIQRLGSQPWCAVPILFLSEALSCLPDSPLLGTDGLNALREVMRCTMITHQVLLRGAAQCFLLRSALRLTDVTAVSVDDVFSFLTHFRPDESLCRGTSLWIQLCAWLSINEDTFNVRAYVQSEMHTFLQVPASMGQNESLPDPKEADKLARAVLLCVDMQENTDSGLEVLLSPLLDTLSRISTNVYLPLHKTDKCLQLLLRLLQLKATPRCHKAEDKQGDRVAVDMEKIMLRIFDPVQEFILRRLCGELVEVCDVARAELYLGVLRHLVAMYGGVPQYRSKMQQTYFPKVIRGCLRTLQEPTPQILSVPGQVSRAVAMASLATVCVLVEQQHMSDQRSETAAALSSLNDYFYSSVQCASNSQSPLGRFNQRLLKPQTIDSTSDAGMQGPVLKNWGHMSAHFMRDQWICLSFLMRAGVVSDTEETPRIPGGLEAALACCVEALSLLPNDLVLPVLAFMEQVLPKVVHAEEDLCVEAVSVLWELVQGLSNNPHDFWPGLRSFVSMAYHRELLALTGAPKFTAMLKQVASDMVELSQCKTGVFNVLIQHCCHTWLPGLCAGPGGSRRWDVNATFSSTFVHIDILTEACVYGPVFRRDQRLIQEVQTYVEQLGEQCSANAVVPGEDRDEQMARTCALAFLSRLEGSDPLHEKLMEELVTLLLKKDKEISRSKMRYYNNSLQHRVKNRVWQTLLLLLPKLKEEFVVTVLNQVFEAGFCSNQASVKYLMEWMMILILFHYPQHIERLWACFNVDQEKTKTSICTFLSVLVHLNIILPLTKDKAVQWRRALDVCLQWCFCHNFSVRLYALLALKRVWSLGPGVREEAQAQQGPCDGLGGLASVVETCLNQAEAMQNSGNANKNWIRIQEHFFFGAFHPIRDYSIETIFHTFPSLSEVSDDEWIPPWKFEKLSGFSESPTLPLRNPVPDLSQLPPGDWVQQDKGREEQDREERWAEVQKKITPWRLGIHEQDPELQPLVPQQRASRLGMKLHGALVVVASLIDKPTNLGGLCRTCEIFGASVLVLDSLRHVADKHFQALSVSSELWLPLQEVKPAELPDFLLLKKSEGYCIVGVEQTANSHSLQDYQFPEKTLLLLGNEREGIPANLLQLLDVCVEIPQQGIIRSLNVHVSAALLIWEYTRQHFTSG